MCRIQATVRPQRRALESDARCTRVLSHHRHSAIPGSSNCPASCFTDEETESKVTPIHGQNIPATQHSGPLTTFSCAAHLGSCHPMGLLLPPCPPRPLRQEPSQPLRESLIPVSGKQTNSLLHLFHKSPDLIRFSSFLPVLGQSLLRAVENSFAPAVRKRLSPVRKIIKLSSHIRGNESPFRTQFAGRLFPLQWRRRCRLNLSSCQVDPHPLAPFPLISPQRPCFLLEQCCWRGSL